MTGASGAEVKVTLLDVDGLPLANQTIEVGVEPAEGAELGPIEATDATGVTEFKLTSTSVGTRSLTISVGQVVLSQQAVVKFTSDQVADAIINTGGIQQVGQLVTIEITLQNDDQQPVSGKMIELVVKPADEVDITQPSQASDEEGKLTAQLLSKTITTKILSLKMGDLVLEDTAAMLFQPGPVDKI